MVLYIHGVSNSFSEAAFTMGEMCHFLGREFVCAIFSWPAGGKHGILFGYEEDYESSAFAVEHLRKAIRTIADTPGSREFISSPTAAGPTCSPPRCPSFPSSRTCRR